MNIKNVIKILNVQTNKMFHPPLKSKFIITHIYFASREQVNCINTVSFLFLTNLDFFKNIVVSRILFNIQFYFNILFNSIQNISQKFK